MDTVSNAANVQPPEWHPTAEQVRQIRTALTNEAYPPQSRWGVGTVARRHP
jgi:hypothetical protein